MAKTTPPKEQIDFQTAPTKDVPEKKRQSRVSTRGPKHVTVPVDRRVKVYAISEYEMSHLGTLGFFSSFFFSVGTFFMSFGGGLMLDIVQESDITTKNVPLVNWIVGALAVVGVFFWITGAICIYFRISELNKIKSEVIQSETSSS